jgi:hypothetical protein
VQVFGLRRTWAWRRTCRKRVVLKNNDLIEVVCEHARRWHPGHSRTNNDSLPAKI